MSLKKSACMISVADSCGDAVAAEFVLSLKEGYPHVEVFGITGRSMDLLNVHKVMSFRDLGTREPFNLLGRHVLLEKVKRAIIARSPKLIILVGFSPFHRQIAIYGKSKAIPVFLVTDNPISSWHPNMVSFARSNCDLVLSLVDGPQEVFEHEGIRSTMIGCPFYQRFSKIRVRKHHLGLEEDKRVVSFILPEHPRRMQRTLRFYAKLLEELKERFKDVSFLGLCPTGVSLDTLQHDLGSHLEVYDLQRKGLVFYENMTLECLAVSEFAVCASGLNSLQAVMLNVPHIVVQSDMSRFGQTWFPEELCALIPTFRLQASPSTKMCEAIDHLLLDLKARQEMSKLFKRMMEFVHPFDYDILIDSICHLFSRRGMSRRQSNRAQ